MSDDIIFDEYIGLSDDELSFSDDVLSGFESDSFDEFSEETVDTVSGSDADGSFTVLSPDGTPIVSGEGTPVINANILDFDYDALYDSFYNASYDAIETYSQSVTDGQQVNSTALSYFQGILNNKFLPVDYVIWVGDDYRYNNSTYYEYCMAYGDLELNGTSFTGTGTVVTLRVNGNRQVYYAHDQHISLDAPMYYSRSNLGDYSGVVSYDWSGLFILLSLVMGGVVWFVKKLLRISY